MLGTVLTAVDFLVWARDLEDTVITDLMCPSVDRLRSFNLLVITRTAEHCNYYCKRLNAQWQCVII